MVNRPTHSFILLGMLISLQGIPFTSCHIFSDPNTTVEQTIKETDGLKEYFASLSLERQKEFTLQHMQNWDTNTEKVIMEEIRFQSSLETPSKNMENGTQLELKRIEPFGMEDYPFSEKDYLDSSNFTNDINTNGSEYKVRYFLYTKKNPLNPDELYIDDMAAITNSTFIKNAPVKVIIHGYTGNIHHRFPRELKNSYVNERTRDLNIILIDWRILAKGTNYIAALHNSPIVAKETAQFVKFLVEGNVTTLDQVHLIGHSLGSHVAGDAGYYINQLMGQQVPRVTGLDPIRPIFGLTDQRGRIDPSDGAFVDIIHTSGLQVGLLRSLGHADFYLNGGIFQPACFDNSRFMKLVHDKQPDCLHLIAQDYFAETILYPMGFRACKCNENILAGFSTCHCNGTDSTAYMGEYLSPRARGIYYLETNEKPLYGKGSI